MLHPQVQIQTISMHVILCNGSFMSKMNKLLDISSQSKFIIIIM